MANYVIGSGLSGLIAGYILEWPVIGNEVGGQMRSPFSLGPRILEYTPQTVWLLANLGLKNIQPKVFKVGFLGKDSNIQDTPDENFRKEYYEKTRLEDNNMGLYIVPPSIMSGGRKEIIGWDMNELNLIKILRSKVALINTRVSGIFTGSDTMFLDDLSQLGYDNLVSTIPLDVLDDLAGGTLGIEGADFRAYDTVFICGQELKGSAIKDSDKNYFYIADKQVPYHRVTKIGEDTSVYEIRADRYMGILPIKTFRPMYKHILSKSQIRKSMNLDHLLNIKLIGRYAQWNHGIKTEDVIKEALDYGKQVGAFR